MTQQSVYINYGLSLVFYIKDTFMHGIAKLQMLVLYGKNNIKLSPHASAAS